MPSSAGSSSRKVSRQGGGEADKPAHLHRGHRCDVVDQLRRVGEQCPDHLRPLLAADDFEDAIEALEDDPDGEGAVEQVPGLEPIHGQVQTIHESLNEVGQSLKRLVSDGLQDGQG